MHRFTFECQHLIFPLLDFPCLHEHMGVRNRNPQMIFKLLLKSLLLNNLLSSGDFLFKFHEPSIICDWSL